MVRNALFFFLLMFVIENTCIAADRAPQESVDFGLQHNEQDMHVRKIIGLWLGEALADSVDVVWRNVVVSKLKEVKHNTTSEGLSAIAADIKRALIEGSVVGWAELAHEVAWRIELFSNDFMGDDDVFEP